MELPERSWLSREFRLEAGVDALSFGKSIAGRSAQGELEDERERAWNLFLEGANLDRVAWGYQSVDDIRKYIMRRLLNAVADNNLSAEEKANACIVASDGDGYLSQFDNRALVGIIDQAPWDLTAVTQARDDINAVGNGFRNLNHGLDPLDIDF